MTEKLIHSDESSRTIYWDDKDLLIMSCEKNAWSPKARRFSNESEDSISVNFDLGNKYPQAKKFYFFGVYDGHGVQDAHKISKLCSELLPENIAKNLTMKHKNEEQNVINAIKKGFAATEQYMKDELFREAQDSGSTALIAANIGDSPGFISSRRLCSLQITKEHDVHNKAEILRLRQQTKEKDGVGFSIYRLAPGRREKSWACITNRLRAYKRLPTQVLLSYIKQHLNSENPLKSACDELVKLCDLVSQSGYCIDDMSIIVIVFLNGKTLKKWCIDASKRAENPEEWLKNERNDDDEISDISEEDLGEDGSPENNIDFDIYDTSNQYSAEEAEEFDDLTVPDT
ncbi:6600_t:CDS:2 [Dentiscutata heterogama]|uniref:6600_t:CDS:1 n=1 Tax=Dentiscutata heterogama TaxID=1316150 RepID=A0ACA9KEC8_9GLOM|nr:6600_t:CDS:2 [Dentiscutata heterogama]